MDTLEFIKALNILNGLLNRNSDMLPRPILHSRVDGETEMLDREHLENTVIPC